jgi:hypothetical protein
MANFSTFWAGMLVFFIFEMVAVILVFYGGMMIDKVYNQTATLPHGDEVTYQKMQHELPWFTNMYYLVAGFCALLGAVVFGQSIVKQIRESQYTYRQP